MSKRLMDFMLLALLFSSETAFAKPCNATLLNPCIVLETENANDRLNNLRDSLMIAYYYQGDISGVDKLWVSASEVPTRRGLKEITHVVRDLSKDYATRLVLVDLRQESHGYVNGRPVTLISDHNWINLGKTIDQIKEDELSWLDRLSGKKILTDVLNAKQLEARQFYQGREVTVHRVEDEASVVKEMGIFYERIYVPDHRRPSDEETERFLDLLNALPANAWIHFHCRGGKGRSSTFLAMMDMLRNADKVSFEQIIERQASIPPYYKLSEVVKSDPELTQYYKERYAFLKNFYQYSRSRLKGQATTWKAWQQGISHS